MESRRNSLDLRPRARYRTRTLWEEDKSTQTPVPAGAAELGCLKELLSQQLETIHTALGAHRAIMERLRGMGLEAALFSSPRGTIDEERSERSLPSSMQSFRLGAQTQAQLPRAAAIPRRFEEDGPGASSPSSIGSFTKRSFTTPLLSSAETRTQENAQAVQACAIFPDKESVKDFVRSSLLKDTYDVEKLYKDVGWIKSLVCSHGFRNASLAVILFNTLWISYDTDYNKASMLIDAEWQFQVADNFFTLFFTAELLLRFLAFKHTTDALRSGWFLFDTFLVLVMVWETWVCTLLLLFVSTPNTRVLGSSSSVFRSLRLVRLLRSGRVLRLLHAFPELMILVQAMRAAMRSVCGTLCLMLIIMYVFAISLTQLLSGTKEEAEGFETVPQSMNTLLKNGVFPDQQAILDEMAKTDATCCLVFGLYLALGTLALMNLLIGVLCEVVAETSRAEKEVMRACNMKERLLEVCPMIDCDHSKTISAEEFRTVFFNPKACKLFNDLGVDLETLVDAAELIYTDYNELNFNQFVEIVLRHRGDSMATVRDVVDIRRTISREARMLEQRLMRRL